MNDQISPASPASCSRTPFALIAVAIAGSLLAFASPLQAQAPEPMKPADVLIWPERARFENFWHMETRLPHVPVARGEAVRPLKTGKPIRYFNSGAGKAFLEEHMRAEQTVGLLVLQDGKVRLERYRDTLVDTRHWASFSVTKSMTSLLYAAAIKDGLIKSVDDQVVAYLPELKGSAYDGVTIAHLLSMSSGVKWSENYKDPQSDVARMYTTPADPGFDPIVSYMRKLPRVAAPGSKFVYKTGETDLAGILLQRITGKPLPAYLSEKIWKPLGMQQDGYWMINERGDSPAGCCLSASLRDLGRMGEFVRNGGVIDGKPIVDQALLRAATSQKVNTGIPGIGYGYFWWIPADGTYSAIGIFGQLVHIDPKRKLVVVVLAAWPSADEPHKFAARMQLLGAINKAVDKE